MDLNGKTVLTTRAVAQSGTLREGLEALGARVLESPTIEIVPITDWTAVDSAIQQLSTYDWLLLTSANTVEYFFRRLKSCGVTCKIPIAVVGAGTAQRLREWGLQTTLIPSEFRAEGLLAAMPSDLTDKRILLPRAEIARDILPATLRERGAHVEIITVYRTVRPDLGERSIAEVLTAEKIDCIVFTSPSTIRYLAEALGDALHDLLKGIPIAVIGPITRDAVRDLGLPVSIMAASSTIEGLIQAIRTYQP